MCDHAEVRPGGVGQHLVARFQQGSKHKVECLNAPLRDHHLIRARLVAVAPGDFVGQGFAQLGKASVGGVAGMPARAASWAASTMCEGVGKSGSPTSRWMTSGSSQASSMISRMRETGMELAIDEGSAPSLAILVSWGRNEPPPLSLTFTSPPHAR